MNDPVSSSQRLTVLQVIPRLQSGGAEVEALEVARRLVSDGHRAIVVSQGGRMVEALEDIGASHVTLPVASKNPLTMAANVTRLATVIRRDGVDIIHARSRAPAWSAWRAARRTGTAFVTTYHSDYSAAHRLKRFYNSVMARSDAVIAVSQAIKDSIVRQYPWSRDRVVVIHRGIDPALFDRSVVDADRIARLRHAWHVPDSAPIVLLAARLSPRKGHRPVIEAMPLASQLGAPPFVLVCAGGEETGRSSYAAELRDFAERCGVAERLRTVGIVEDMPAAYAASDLTLNVSSAEGFPRVALESQAMQVPVITADHGPGREAVLSVPDVPADEASGLQVPFGDPPSLARSLHRFFAMPEEERRAMGMRGAQRVRSTFTIERLTTETLAVYGRLAAARRASAGTTSKR
jgi:glycosyltransferase involved in cell wall biosynthesis